MAVAFASGHIQMHLLQTKFSEPLKDEEDLLSKKIAAWLWKKKHALLWSHSKCKSLVDFWGGELFCPQDGVQNALIIAVLSDISSSSETIKNKVFFDVHHSRSGRAVVYGIKRIGTGPPVSRYGTGAFLFPWWIRGDESLVMVVTQGSGMIVNETVACPIISLSSEPIWLCNTQIEKVISSFFSSHSLPCPQPRGRDLVV